MPRPRLCAVCQSCDFDILLARGRSRKLITSHIASTLKYLRKELRKAGYHLDEVEITCYWLGENRYAWQVVVGQEIVDKRSYSQRPMFWVVVEKLAGWLTGGSWSNWPSSTDRPQRFVFTRGEHTLKPRFHAQFDTRI